MVKKKKKKKSLHTLGSCPLAAVRAIKPARPPAIGHGGIHAAVRALATGSTTKCPLSSKSPPHAHKVGRSPTRWVHNKPHGPSKCKGRAATGVATTTGRSGTHVNT